MRISDWSSDLCSSDLSCNTFFYRIGYDFWSRYGRDVADVNAKDPLVAEAKEFGFGAETGIDIPGEAPGRIADRKWKKQYYESQKDYYCDLAKNPPKEASAFLQRSEKHTSETQSLMSISYDVFCVN